MTKRPVQSTNTDQKVVSYQQFESDSEIHPDNDDGAIANERQSRSDSAETDVGQPEKTRQNIEQMEHQGTHHDWLASFLADTSSSAVEVVTGADGIRATLAALSMAAEAEVATFAPGGAEQTKQVPEARKITEQMFARGIYSRSVFLVNLRKERLMREYVTWLNKHGAEVRTAPTLPIRMIIQDRKVAVLPLDPDNTMTGIVICRLPGVVLALQALFENIWETSIPLGVSCSHNKHGLTIEDQTILDLLALGRTTAEIAESTGSSDRTTRRKIGNLLARLGTESAFAGGYLAVKNGWI